MIPAILCGNLTYWLLPLGESPPEEPLQENDVNVRSNVEQIRLRITSEAEAFAVLRPLGSDTLIMHGLRHLAQGLGLSKPFNRKDWEVVDYLALQMVRQRLFVVRRLILPRGGTDDEAQQPKASAAAPAPAPSAKVAEPDPPTFDPDLQQDQQAGGLIAASKDGVPFCEECARAAAGKAA